MILSIQPSLVRKPYVIDKPSVHRQLIADPDNYQQSDADVGAVTFREGVCRIPRIRQRPDMKVGVMGDPRGASAGLGKKVLDEAVKNLIQYLKAK
jgi:creatinine amidohydrolase/Fe(II)-dependent formamide hydrolase-like protein